MLIVIVVCLTNQVFSQLQTFDSHMRHDEIIPKSASEDSDEFASSSHERAPAYSQAMPKYSEVIHEPSSEDSQYQANSLGAQYERLKSTMFYRPKTNDEIVTNYIHTDYHMDDDDVRTSARANYENWPYFYHSPYEYEHSIGSRQIEKANDKSYNLLNTLKEIPVHEHHENDVPNIYHNYRPPSLFYIQSTTDNPMKAEDPFFKFILNDYFDHNHDEDMLTFKGEDWGINDVDTIGPHRDITDLDERNKRNRRKNQRYQYDTARSDAHIKEPKHLIDNHDYNQHNLVNQNKVQTKGEYDLSKKGQIGFKDFVDGFANKFGIQDHKNDANYMFNNNSDKGEKMKGFRRVYHKDEYQEDKEFYNNNGQKFEVGEQGGSKVHVGGSEGLLKSVSAAALGDHSDSINNSASYEHLADQNINKAYEKLGIPYNPFNQYRDIAKQAAQSNQEDYFDPFRIQ